MVNAFAIIEIKTCKRFKNLFRTQHPVRLETKTGPRRRMETGNKTGPEVPPHGTVVVYSLTDFC